jgi:hypothetical protein
MHMPNPKVRESGNFKIRTHAAAALAALPSREAYGDVLPDALLVVAAALEGMSGSGAGAAAAAAAAGAGGEAQGGGAGVEGEAEPRFPNFRYAPGLAAQLRATALHLLALVAPEDARRVREPLARRADALHGLLRAALADATAAAREAALEVRLKIVAFDA